MEDPDGGLLGRHSALARAVAAGQPLVPGNRLDILQDGPATYASMKAAIKRARDHINLQTYIIEDDEVGREFADLLLERRRAGVEVNLIYDSVGALGTPASYFERLQAGGIRVVEFNPVNPLTARSRVRRFIHRDHRKLLVVDGCVAFVGGINISKVYSSGSFRARRRRRKRASGDTGWRDTHLRLEGPVVARFQELFLDSWSRQKGPPLPPGRYFPRLDAAGDAVVQALGSRAGDPQSVIHEALHEALRNAQERAWLTVAYFAPDPVMMRCLAGAAARGVDVRMIMPCKSDMWPVYHCGRSYYARLLECGVRVFERRGSVMHAKTAVVDGVWSTIGSTNLDWRSVHYNDELNAVVLDAGFGAEMERMFEQDIGQSAEVMLRQWRKRPFPLRLFEWVARGIERVL